MNLPMVDQLPLLYLFLQIEVKGLAKGQGGGNGLPHVGQGIAEVQVL